MSECPLRGCGWIQRPSVGWCVSDPWTVCRLLFHINTHTHTHSHVHTWASRSAADRCSRLHINTNVIKPPPLGVITAECLKLADTSHGELHTPSRLASSAAQSAGTAFCFEPSGSATSSWLPARAAAATAADEAEGGASPRRRKYKLGRTTSCRSEAKDGIVRAEKEPRKYTQAWWENPAADRCCCTPSTSARLLLHIQPCVAPRIWFTSSSICIHTVSKVNQSSLETHECDRK